MQYFTFKTRGLRWTKRENYDISMLKLKKNKNHAKPYIGQKRLEVLLFYVFSVFS